MSSFLHLAMDSWGIWCNTGSNTRVLDCIIHSGGWKLSCEHEEQTPHYNLETGSIKCRDRTTAATVPHLWTCFLSRRDASCDSGLLDTRWGVVLLLLPLVDHSIKAWHISELVNFLLFRRSKETALQNVGSQSSGAMFHWTTWRWILPNLVPRKRQNATWTPDNFSTGTNTFQLCVELSSK